MKHRRAYKYRCYPTPEQGHILARTFGCARFAYNWALRLRTDAYYQRQERVYYSDTSAAMTTLKKQAEYAWLNEVSCVPVQQAMRHLDKAFRNFFEGRAKYPTFKKKHGRQSAEYTTSAFKWDGKDLLLAKVTEPLAIHWSRPLPKDAKPTTITITKDTAGRYFVSFLVEENFKTLDVAPQTVGIDLGLHDTVTLSTGEKVGNEKFFSKDERLLATLQRRLARKQKGSKNRVKAKLKVARIHAHIADRRQDFLHKLTTRLIHENQVLCVESLSVKNMLKNHNLAKAIADVGWGELIRQLQYKAAWYGRSVVAIDKWYPSSKRCYNCGHILEFLSLDVRQWTCPECGMVHDRDINAALNIKAAGLAVFACGEMVRPGRARPAKAQPREAGRSSL
ncbi:MAG TPA: RNA-guided endonuclease TnpB family protein [Ktedonobacterales bacterium]|nr:RNA-guided endonuclease TnpB family protein [Ktedonobacterales bacterium]